MVDGGNGLTHAALFYRDGAEYRAQILRFARVGLSCGDPLFVALPGGAAHALGDQLGSETGDFRCPDMAEVGRNPARIIPELRAFIDKHAGQRVRIIAEPIWPGRSPAEIREAIRHEALVNLAFSRVSAAFLCPFDVSRLAPSAIAGAGRTHPEHFGDAGPPALGARPPAPEGRPPAWQVPPECDVPLSGPPASAETIAYRTDLAPVRRLVEGHAQRAGLAADRAADLVLAASELAANTLGHTASGGMVQVWHDESEILCQTHDQGWISDPLAGRVRRAPGSRGHGLFLVNHVCDLVEMRTGRAGTTVRMHMSLRGDGRAAR